MRSLPGMRAAGRASTVLGDAGAFADSGILARYGTAFDVAGKVSTLVAVALAGLDVAMAWKAEGSFDHRVRQRAASDAGGVAGGIEGAELGAAWGTMLLPGWGTVAGGILGGIAGGVIGSKAGSMLEDAGEHVVHDVGSAVHKLTSWL